METKDLLKIVRFDPAGWLISKTVEESIKLFSKSSEKSTLEKLKEDAIREDIKSSVLQNQAKVAQELAIARRIDNAEEVEIEEYYDISGNGGLGIKSDEKGINLGLNVEGRKVTKRIIKFKGYRPIEQNLSSNNELDKI